MRVKLKNCDSFLIDQFNSLPEGANFLSADDLLNSLDPDQAPQNVRPDLDPN